MQEPSWVINRQKAERFFVAVEATYKGDNHYHNSTHAADVAQAAMIILRAGQNSLNFTKLEVFSLICAAAVHDLGHPGFTNDFLINTQHVNAITYNDRSVNENFHVSCAFRIVTQSEETNIFSGLSRAEYVVVSEHPPGMSALHAFCVWSVAPDAGVPCMHSVWSMCCASASDSGA